MVNLKKTPAEKKSGGLGKIAIILLLLAALLLLGIIFYYNGKSIYPVTALDKEISVAKADGLDWLLGSDQHFSDMGVIWILKNINDRYCQDERLQNLWQSKKEGALAKDKYQEAYNKLLEPNYEFIYDEADLQKNATGEFDEIFIPIIYCSDRGVQDANVKLLAELSDQGGYISAHALLGAYWIKERGCYDEEIIDEIIVAKANELIQAQNQDQEFSDLYAERVAFLIYAGFRQDIKPEWIKTILEAQQNDGGWPTGIGEPASYHATALAMWALVQYTGSCR